MGKQITGQSIRYEPSILGVSGFHKTGLQRFVNARGDKSRLNVLQREAKSGSGVAMSTTETLQRTLAQNPRQQVVSNGLMTAPLISGRASDTSGGVVRTNERAEGRDMMLVNTIRNAQDIPQI